MFWPFRKRLPNFEDLAAQREYVYRPQSNGLEFQIASDVGNRDGLGVELVDNEANLIVAEVFRSDRDNTLTFTCFANVELPFSLVEQMFEITRRRLEPFEDETPLSGATNQYRLD